MLKNTLKLVIPIIVLALLSACASDDKPPQPAVIKAFEAQADTPASKINSIRRTAIINTATSLGAQAGLAWRSEQINKDLRSNTKRLNGVFNFRGLMLKNNVLPPILVEGRDSLNLASNTTLRLADRVYKIISPPRFVTAPPTWREYLWMQYKTPEKPNSILLPENANERTVWNQYINVGWKEGIKQADQIFAVNLGRLKRDFNGMILYRQLLAQNMVSAPFVAKSDLGVTGNSKMMRINDQVLRITATSKLNTDPSQWKPALTQLKQLPKAVFGQPRFLK